LGSLRVLERLGIDARSFGVGNDMRQVRVGIAAREWRVEAGVRPRRVAVWQCLEHGDNDHLGSFGGVPPGLPADAA
jgi:hypothetical protein